MGLATMLITSGANGASLNGKATFGFAVQFTSGSPAPTGNLTYLDHTANVSVKSTSYATLVIAGTHATFTGTATVNGVMKNFKVDVDDLSEPGSGSVAPDTFSIEILEPGGYMAAGPLIGGNIQIHQ
jgi:hypothetical protein